MRLSCRIKKWILYLLAPACPTWCSRVLFRGAFSRELDLENPSTFDEKLQWLKLNTYRDDPLVAQCADKLRARDYVRAAGCGEILNDLYGVWDSADAVDWDAVAYPSVLKCNHGSGYNLFIGSRDKTEHRVLTEKLRRWMREDYWRFCAELQYRNIPKRIICERLLGQDVPLYDYKIYCFHGVPRYIMTCVGRAEHELKFYFFDSEWNFCRINRDSRDAPEEFSIPRPAQLCPMLEYARKLSAPFPFVRVDLYDEEGRVVFGELTFTPAAAMDVARLPEADKIFGELLDLKRG